MKQGQILTALAVIGMVVTSCSSRVVSTETPTITSNAVSSSLSSSSVQSSSPAKSSTPLSTLELSLWKNGKVDSIERIQVDGRADWKVAIGPDGQRYVALSTKVLRLNGSGKEPTVIYSDDALRRTSGIVQITPSLNKKLLYILQSYADPMTEGLGEQALVELNLDTLETRIIDRAEPGIYTKIDFIANVRRGDVLYCHCGGEGGGAWGKYYLLGPDGSREEVVSYGPGPKGVGTFEYVVPLGYVQQADSILFGERMNKTASSPLFLYNIHLRERTLLRGVPADFYPWGDGAVLSSDGTRLALLTEQSHLLLSVPSGEIIRKRILKEPLQVYIQGFISDNDLWGYGHQGFVTLNFDGPSPLITPFAPLIEGGLGGGIPGSDGSVLIFRLLAN